MYDRRRRIVFIHVDRKFGDSLLRGDLRLLCSVPVTGFLHAKQVGLPVRPGWRSYCLGQGPESLPSRQWKRRASDLALPQVRRRIAWGKFVGFLKNSIKFKVQHLVSIKVRYPAPLK